MIDLQQFCSDEQQSTSAPWSDETNTYATDGFIGVRVARRADVAATSGPDLAGLLSRQPAASDLQPLPPITVPPGPTCTSCNGSGKVITCTDCKGEGLISCWECGHDTECKSCDGAGESSAAADSAGATQCTECNGTGRSFSHQNRPLYLVAPGVVVSAALIERISRLPGCQIDRHPPTDGSPIRFEFDGGDGLVMPLAHCTMNTEFLRRIININRETTACE